MSAKDVFEKRSKKILKQNSADTVGNQVESHRHVSESLKTAVDMFHKLILVNQRTLLNLALQRNITSTLLREFIKPTLMMALCMKKQVG